jgi:hypothetical protein
MVPDILRNWSNVAPITGLINFGPVARGDYRQHAISRYEEPRDLVPLADGPTVLVIDSGFSRSPGFSGHAASA